MITRLFFTQPFRRWIIRCRHALPLYSRLDTWILDQLYPDDCIVHFGPRDDR